MYTVKFFLFMSGLIASMFIYGAGKMKDKPIAALSFSIGMLFIFSAYLALERIILLSINK